MEHILDHDDRKEIERCIKDKRRAEKKDQLKEVASLCNSIGHIYAKYGQWSEAISEYEAELGLHEALEDTIGAAVACRNLGECYCGLEQFDKALLLQQRHLTLARSCNSNIEEQRALATIGRTYLVEADTSLTKGTRLTVLGKAEDAFVQSLEICMKLGEDVSQIESAEMRTRLYLNLGLVYEGKGDMSVCSQYMKKAIGLSQKFNLYNDLYLCQFNLASMYQRACNYDQAQKFITQACATAKKMRSKLQETEAMYQRAVILLQIEEFSAARHLFKKCKKYGSADPEKVNLAYKTVVKMEKIQEELKSLREGDNSRTKLHEKMADTAVDIGNYKQAITYYSKTLAQLKSSGADKTELIPIYVSLAQTYKDDKQYDKAIDNYQSEIRLRGADEGDQICRSWLNIAEVQELQGLEYNDVSKSYLTAYETAKKAKQRKLQVRSLMALCELQKLFKKDLHKTKTEAKLAEIRSKFNLPKGIDLEEESQDMEGSSEEEVEMSDLTESEDEETGTSTRTVQGASRKISHKRNHLGETPLHRACIEGNLKRVKKLIEEGHPLNPQDNSGWTPLHEASNHGFYDIVEHLLKHGAAKDHRGGDQCGGTTPLIDAASCGNVDVMQLLIDHGANVLCKDDKHKTALDTLLDWYQENETRDSEFLTIYNNVVELMKEKTPGKGSSSKRQESILSQSRPAPLIPESMGEDLPPISRYKRDTTRHRSRNDIIKDMDSGSDSDSEQELPRKRNSSPRAVKYQETEDLEEIHLNPLLDDLDISSNATEAYRSAMSSIGGSAARASKVTRSGSHKSSAAHSALIQEEEYIDDWLVDDLQPMKRRKMDVNGLFTTDSTKNRKQAKESIPNHRTEQKGKENKKSVRCRIEESDSDNDSDARSIDKEIHNRDGDITDNTTAIPVQKQKENKSATCRNEESDCKNESDARDNTSVIPDCDSLENELDYGDPLYCYPVDGLANLEPNDSLYNLDNCDNDVEAEPIIISDRPVNPSKPKQLKITSFGTRISAASDASSAVPGLGSSRLGESRVSTVREPSSVPVIPTNEATGSGIGHIAGVVRIKVQIKDKLLLVPVFDREGTKTISWLSEETSQRYSKMFGLKPVLSLGTKDGAFFSPDDIVTHILADNDKIEGFIKGWDLPPMVERYTDACKDLKVVSYSNVKTLLQQCETTGRLSLPNLALRAARFQPIIQSLQYQTCVKELNIAGNRIGDVGLESLCKILDTLPNLTALDLTCNDITPAGLNHLCSVVTEENVKCLQALSQLNLSHNSLMDGCLVQLSTLLSNLPLLERLDLSSCGFTVKLFQKDRLQFATALQASTVQHMNFSLNELGCVGVELLLKCQLPTRLVSLDLSHTVQQPSGQVYRHLYNFLSEEGSVLQDLRLKDCHLGLEDVELLWRLPSVGKHLQRLDLSVNPKLDSQALQQLINASCESSSLEEVKFTGCGLFSPLEVTFLDAIVDKLASTVPLRKLQFTCRKLEKLDAESLSQIWRKRWAELARVDIDGQSVKLSVAGK